MEYRPRKRNQPSPRRRPWTEAVGEPFKHSYSFAAVGFVTVDWGGAWEGGLRRLAFRPQKRAPAGLTRCKSVGLTPLSRRATFRYGLPTLNSRFGARRQ